MIPSCFGSLMYVKGRKVMELFPGNLRKLWKDWELRVMVLVSLSLQIILIFFGNRRKYSSKIWVRVVLWCAYLMADWVATVALGVISNNLGDVMESVDKGGSLDADAELTAFWAPFLLLHLGGPDTVTAYSLEDNELWLRHLLGLGVQTGVALYIFLMAWTGSPLSLLSIPVFCAGIIKYGERTWVLRSASNEKFRDSMLTPADPGPNYSKFMQEYTLKQFEGYHVTADEVIEAQAPVNHSLAENYSIPDAAELLTAHELLHVFQRLFVELILGFDDREKSQSLFRGISLEKAFKVIEIELGFVYDVLYTKATVIYLFHGCCLRFISFSCTFGVLVFFSFAEHKYSHSHVDLLISYLLLYVALLLEGYAIILLISSDWTNHWLTKHANTSIRRAITCLQLPNKNHRWSNSIAQFNALSFYLKMDKPTFSYEMQKLLCLDSLLEKFRYMKHKQVSGELRTLIFDHLKEKFEHLVAPSIVATDIRTVLTCRGGGVLEKYYCTELDWSIKVDFDQSILIWHIATHLCYYKDHTEIFDNTIALKHKLSKRLSQYMVYLLVMRPFMLPVGIGMIRFRDTQAEITKFFEEHKPSSLDNSSSTNTHSHGSSRLRVKFFSWARNKPKLDKSQACNMLLKVNTAVPAVKVKGDRSKSVLFDACRLASELQAISDKCKKWEMISDVWVEMLAYAASQCRGNHHAQQLRRGGELLTHVWLLMAHFGLTEQFQISQGHARVKLVVK
ncbi:uncharacterized protein LOC133794572 [Humulus lupulus]|uniref:uncharacterized protein LOC133794572 n=1 Tax=Humulus lupulus TaxID=3486 RepID=UPI002B414E6A|nr:uncharacterized protein LOC133794572 [Humulus lupulus]